MAETLEFSLPDWVDLQARYPEAMVLAVRLDYERGGNPAFEPRRISADDPDTAEALLRELAAAGGGGPWLKHEPRYRCEHCDETLSEADHRQRVCPNFDCATRVDGAEWAEREEPVWRPVDPEPVRRAGWMLALHGMNTRGPWQETFNWLVSRSYGQMVPVAVYKYGVVRQGAFLKFLQRRHRERLAERMRRYARQAEVAGFQTPPDVIAHSFGTWLLGRALLEDLKSPGTPPLRVGRVILTGCILRPTFPWKRLLEPGPGGEPPRVEAVLNHYGTRDFWALVAHYAIPGSGPAGRRGFNAGDARVLNLEAQGFSHSQFFEADELPGLFARSWSQFLSRPVDRVARRLGTGDPDDAWRPAPWLLRARLARWLVLGLAGAAVLLLAAALPLGLDLAVAEPRRAAVAAAAVFAGAAALKGLAWSFGWLARQAPWPW